MEGRLARPRERPPQARLRADGPSRVTPADPPRRVPELDGLRGLAAVAIVCFHWSPGRLPGGWSAVDLFFVLSGYLITSIILQHGTSPGFLKTFYARRALRIWPTYYLTVLAVACVRFFVPQRIRWAGLPYTLTYTQFIGRHGFVELPDYCPYLWHTWTLAIEEQFYLLWPVILLALGRRRVIPLALGCVAVAVLGRAGGWQWGILGSRCDALAMGGILAALFDRTAGVWRTGTLRTLFAAAAAAGVVLLVAVARQVGLNLPSGPPPWPGLTLLATNSIWFGLVGLVVLYAGAPALGLLTRKPLLYLGRISYGLYLYHFVAIMLTAEYLHAHGSAHTLLTKAAAIAVSFVIAHLSWRYVEQPLLRRKDRFAYRAPARQPGIEAHSPVSGPRPELARGEPRGHAL